MDIKNNLADYTESEFLEIIEEFFKNKSGLKGSELKREWINWSSTSRKLLLTHERVG